MRLPIKLIKTSVLTKFHVTKFCANSPFPIIEEQTSKAFNDAMSTIKIGNTFKSTKQNRHNRSDKLLCNYINESSVILDIGASTGITSLDVISTLNNLFAKYYITDYNIKVYYNKDKYYYYLFDINYKCILIFNKTCVIYPNEFRLLKWFFKNKIQSFIEKNDLKEALLIDPKVIDVVKSNSKIEVESFSVFDKWEKQKPNIVKVANLLNLAYFTNTEIVNAIKNIKVLMVDNGYLLIVENRDQEQGALFIKSKDQFLLVDKIGPDIDIMNLVLNN